MSFSSTDIDDARYLHEVVHIEGAEVSSTETDASVLDRIVNRLVDFKVEGKVEEEEMSMEEETNEEKTESPKMEVLESESESDVGNEAALGHEVRTGASTSVEGYWTDEDMRFPKHEKAVYVCGDVRVVRMGYKRTRRGKVVGCVYRCRGYKVELPYVSEGDNNKELYEEPLEGKVAFVANTQLSEEKEAAMGVPLYLSAHSKISSDQEAALREDYGIEEEFELIFPNKEMLAHQVPLGCLVAYVAQLKAGLRFPLHPLFKDILKFWSSWVS